MHATAWLQILMLVLVPFSMACTTTGIEKREASFRVTSDPPGASVWLDDGKGRRSLGQAPLDVKETYEADVVDFNEANWWWLVPSVIVTGVGIGFLLQAFTGSGFHDEGLYGGIGMVVPGGLGLIGTGIVMGLAQARESEKPLRSPWKVGVGLNGYASQEDEIALGSSIPEKVFRLSKSWYGKYGIGSDVDLANVAFLPNMVRALADPDPSVRLEAVRAIGRLEGQAQQSSTALEALSQDADPVVRAAAAEALQRIRFSKLAEPAADSVGGTKLVEPVVLAVFEVQDPSKRFKSDVLQQLTEYLAVRLTETGKFRVVPPDQLRQRLFEAKSGTYRACVDESCQIELGRELAATKTLNSKLLRVGDTCVVTATLYDLKSATSEKATSVRSGCDEGKLIDGLDQTVKQLTEQ